MTKAKYYEISFYDINGNLQPQKAKIQTCDLDYLEKRIDQVASVVGAVFDSYKIKEEE